jgi:NAD(P)-dependent dehydrogenase (short-subunit alcohol dehydrogenase family)
LLREPHYRRGDIDRDRVTFATPTFSTYRHPTTQLMTSAQRPIHSGFNDTSTAADVMQGIDLRGKTAIVTGGYSGIGTETTRVLRKAGARVIVPARDRTKAVASLKGLDVEIEAMDLSDPASIDAFAQQFIAKGEPLHLLINNAGIMAAPLTRDARGHESQFATNHLGHFQLTARLWPALVKAHGARVISVSSRGHRYSAFDFDDPDFERRPYDRWVAYGQSKTANALFALHLDAIGEAQGIRAFSLHPGRIATDLTRYMSHEDKLKAGAIDAQGKVVVDPALGMKSIEQGAATNVWTATSPQLNGMGGVYCEGCDIAVTDDKPANAPGDTSLGNGVRPWATNASTAKRLWELSEKLTGAAVA